MEERLRELELSVARLEVELRTFIRETREHRARRNGSHWKERGTIALGGGGIVAILAFIERLIV